MYVRTVWVDGYRHAILTPDDPHLERLRAKLRRPHSSVTFGEKRQRDSRLSHHDDLESCLRKLSLVVTNDSTVQHRPNYVEPNVERLNLNDLDQDSEEELILRSKPQPLNEFESCRSKFNSLCLEMKTLKSNRTSRTDVKENTDLSDKVLQWLDLAGKVDLLAPENEAARMAQPRHSWPEIQKRNLLTKSRTTVDLKARVDKADIAKDYYSSPSERCDIDCRDFYVPAPANTIENYARQSRNKPIARNDIAKPKENVKTKTRDLRKNVQETRQKIATERSVVEKQYAELVSRNILPDYSKSKKQVHIFIPESVQKKSGSMISQSS